MSCVTIVDRLLPKPRMSGCLMPITVILGHKASGNCRMRPTGNAENSAAMTSPMRKPKGITARRRQAKAAGERRVIQDVRAKVVKRDGYCRLVHMSEVGLCSGPSEWAHIGRFRRHLTRGMAPEKRHTTEGTAMLCRTHHTAYDAHRFDIETTPDLGMNGAFVVVLR